MLLTFSDCSTKNPVAMDTYSSSGVEELLTHLPIILFEKVAVSNLNQSSFSLES